MLARLATLLLSGAALLQVHAQDAVPPPADLVGTWNSKAGSTQTGPGFYDPQKETFTEPDHPGISYSFTADGYFEEAYYRAVANPQNPKCPAGIIQWQHGKFSKLTNGSLVLEPIKVDGRQLYSDPCLFKNSVYTRYNATELFERYEVLIDGYTQKTRLNLYKFDGSPMMPLYQAKTTPEMLPTTTLNPLTTPTPAGGKVKRGDLPLNHGVVFQKTPGSVRADQWWWFGVFLTAGGGALYFFF